MLRVPVDTGRLFDGDEGYYHWMMGVASRVSDTRREVDEKERAELNKVKGGR